MKKITLISLVGPVLIIVWRVVGVIKQISVKGFGNNYYCNMSTDAKCSLPYYLFKSDDAVVSYIGIALSFVFLFIIVSYIFLLIRLYKENRLKLFWTLIVITTLLFSVIGTKYYFLGPNLSCAPDSQGIKIYISKSDLLTYNSDIKNGKNWDVISQIRKNVPVYAEISNNCYGKNSYKIKNETGLVDVSKDIFSEYIAKSFNKTLGEGLVESYCNNAVLLTQSGNSPILVSNNFCRFEP